MTTTQAPPVPAQPSPPRAAPHEVVWGLSQGVVASKALHVVAELGVADHLDDQPVTGAALAGRCGVDPDGLDRVLRLLCAHGIFRLDGTAYVHNDASRLLRRDHPQSMRDFARLNSLPVAWGAFGALDHSVRTGAPGTQKVDPDGFFAYLRDHPEEAEVFGHAMAAKARADIADVLAAYDFRRFGTIADIGGGRGHLLQAVLETAPEARGILFDLPEVVDRVEIGNARMSAQAGDFFIDALPDADAYLLMEIIHDWTDPEASAIVGAVRRACRPGATVLILEHIAPDSGVDVFSQTLDVVMLAVTGGRERTRAQLGRLLEDNGFRPTGVTTTRGPIAIVEAVATND
jgi:C-methyltransferase